MVSVLALVRSHAGPFHAASGSSLAAGLGLCVSRSRSRCAQIGRNAALRGLVVAHPVSLCLLARAQRPYVRRLLIRARVVCRVCIRERRAAQGPGEARVCGKGGRVRTWPNTISRGRALRPRLRTLSGPASARTCAAVISAVAPLLAPPCSATSLAAAPLSPNFVSATRQRNADARCRAQSSQSPYTYIWESCHRGVRHSISASPAFQQRTRAPSPSALSSPPPPPPPMVRARARPLLRARAP